MQCMEIWGGNGAFENAVSMPGIDAWVLSQPFAGDARGGDVHYISMCAGGKIARFAVADISGHGAYASDLASTLRSLMRRYINTLNQTRFLRALNRKMVQIAEAGKFATALLATYYAPTDQLFLCNAGHPPPLWYRAARREWVVLKDTMEARLTSAGNLPLGIIQPTQYSQFAVKLEPNDLVLMYTDSLIEAANANGRQLGVDGLLKRVSGIDVDDPAALSQQLLESLAAYREFAPVNDDLTMLLLHHHGAGRPRFSVGERIRTVTRMLGLASV